MIQDIINNFEEQVIEVESYFKTLEKLNDPNLKLYFPQKRTYKYLGLNNDFMKIAKANAFIVLYNLIEANVRNGLLAIYNDMDTNNHTYSNVRPEIQNIWLKSKYRKIFKPSATWESGRKLTARIIAEVVSSSVLKLDEKAIPSAGNLDARKIREICSLHGISEKTHRSAQGGYKLLIVKDQRNALAHGHLTFKECGRQFTLNDLIETKKQVVIYIRSILRNMKMYCDRKRYSKGVN